MRSRAKAAITTTGRSRPETNKLSRNEVSPQGDPHRGRRRSDVNQRNGSEARGKRQRHNERVLLIGRRAIGPASGPAGHSFPAPTGRRHDRTRSVRKALTKPLTTGRRPDMPLPDLSRERADCAKGLVWGDCCQGGDSGHLLVRLASDISSSRPDFPADATRSGGQGWPKAVA